MNQVQTPPSAVRISPRTLDSLNHEVQSIPGSIDHFVAVLEDGSSHALPHELSQVVRRALRALSEQGAVTIGALPEELTSTTAAQLLGISRPTLLKLAAAGELPSHKVGSHTRFKRDDVQFFQAQRMQQKAALLDEILELGDKIDEADE